MNKSLTLFWNPASFFALAQLVVSALNYLFYVIFTRVLDPSLVGTANAVLSLLFILSIPTIFLQNTITHHVSANRATFTKDHLSAISHFLTKNILLWSGLAMVILAMCSDQLVAFLRLPDASVLLLIFIATVLNYALPVPRGMWQAEHRFGDIGIQMLVESILKIVFFFVFIRMLSPLEAIVYSIIVSYVFSALWLHMPVVSRWIAKKTHEEVLIGSIRKAFVDSFFADGMHFLVATLLFTALFNADILLVNYVFPQESADYSVAARIVQLLVFGGASIATANLPVFHEKRTASKIKILRSPLATVALGIAGFFAVMIPYGDMVVSMFFGTGFAHTSYYILILGVGGASLAIANVLMYFLLSRQSYGFLWWLGAIALSQMCVIALSTFSFERIVGIIALHGLALVMVLGGYTVAEQ